MLIALDRRDLAGTVAVACTARRCPWRARAWGSPSAPQRAFTSLVRDDRLRRLWAVAVPGVLYLGWLTGLRRSDSDLGRPIAHHARKGQPPGSAGVCGDSGGRGVGRRDRAGGGLGPSAGARQLPPAGRTSSCRSRALSLRLLALLAAAAAYWGLAAVFRAHVNPPTDSRYLYLGAVLVLLIAVELLPPVVPTTRLLVVLAVFVGASAIANFGSLRSGSQYLQDSSRYVRAELGALELAGAGTRADFAPDPVRAPDITAGKYFAAIRDYGSPASSTSEIARAGEGERQAADSVLLQALGAAVVPGECLGANHPRSKDRPVARRRRRTAVFASCRRAPGLPSMSAFRAKACSWSRAVRRRSSFASGPSPTGFRSSRSRPSLRARADCFCPPGRTSIGTRGWPRPSRCAPAPPASPRR